MRIPLWSFPSGAWMRRSTVEYPILRRALEILRELCADAFRGVIGERGEVISR